MTEPTERSMPPAVMTKVMPMLITPMIDAKRMIVRKLSTFDEAVARGDRTPTTMSSSSAMTRPRLRPAAPLRNRRHDVARLSGGPSASALPVAGGAGGLLAHAAVPFMTRSSTPCSSISVAGVVVEDAAVGDDEHAVGEAEHLLDLARDDDDRGAGVGEPTDEGVDLGAGADVDAAGGLVEQQHAWCRARASGRA